MRTTRLLLTLVVLLLPALAGPAAAQDPFEQDQLLDLRLQMNSADLAQLREHYTENTYYPADIEFRGERVRNVGIRSRGLGSRSATKLGLRVDMNRYTTGQTFLGVKALVLDNLWQDASLVRERLAMAVFARAGLPAPREVFVRLYINNEYEGAYALAEEIGPQFLTAATGRADDVLFEYKWVAAWRGEDLGPAVDTYVPLLEARSHEKDPVDALYGPVRDIFSTAAGLPEEAWRTYVEARLDLPQLLTYLAVETFLADDDGLLGSEGMNNFYLHRPADGLQHRLLPWDKDRAFGDPTASIWLRADENQLVRRALAFPDLRAHYLDELQRISALASDDGWLSGRLDALLATIDPAARDDVRRPHSEEERQAAIAAVRAFATERPARVLADVTQSRAALATQ